MDTTGKLPVRIAKRSPQWAPRSFRMQLAGRMKISCEHSGSPTVRQLPLVALRLRLEVPYPLEDCERVSTFDS